MGQPGKIQAPGHHAHANNKGADQPAYACSLVSRFVVRFLESILPQDI